jgi:hypothetical protein
MLQHEDIEVVFYGVGDYNAAREEGSDVLLYFFEWTRGFEGGCRDAGYVRAVVCYWDLGEDVGVVELVAVVVY